MTCTPQLVRHLEALILEQMAESERLLRHLSSSAVAKDNPANVLGLEHAKVRLESWRDAINPQDLYLASAVEAIASLDFLTTDDTLSAAPALWSLLVRQFGIQVRARTDPKAVLDFHGRSFHLSANGYLDEDLLLGILRGPSSRPGEVISVHLAPVGLTSEQAFTYSALRRRGLDPSQARQAASDILPG